MYTASSLPDHNFGLDLTGQWKLRLPGDSIADFAERMPDSLALTFIDYLADRKGPRRSFTWREWEPWTRAIAHRLSQLAGRTDRVAIMAPQGPEYVAGFHGALRAGVIAVPLFQPDLPGHGDRLEAVFDDCQPTVVITTSDKRELVEKLIASRGRTGEVTLLLPEELLGEAGAADAAAFVPPADLTMEDIAYLQYTSGSTRVPAGVELSHLNLVYNIFQIIQSYGMGQYVPNATGVSWLPLFHDMGLLLGAAATAVVGAHSVLMDPIAFVLKPSRWLTEIAQHPNVFTAGPNFSYALASKKMKPEQLAELDFSNVRTMVNGAEPVLAKTLDTVDTTFGPYGLPANAQRPSYGLAEATLFVSVVDHTKPRVLLSADVAALQQGRLEADANDNGTSLVSCGRPFGLQVVIVDPETLELQPSGAVGEIWVNGPNIGRGYWQKPQESADTFAGQLTPDQARTAGAPEGPWLRTGDLGAFVGEDLFITGRQKDLIIIDGRNIYPHDIEHSVQHAHDAIALHRLAAFAVPTPEGGEGIVVVAERYKGFENAEQHLAQIEAAARSQISQEHSVSLHDFVLISSDTIPWTSSGKIARSATSEAYLAGTLTRVTAG